jgi:hypothetical protein
LRTAGWAPWNGAGTLPAVCGRFPITGARGRWGSERPGSSPLDVGLTLRLRGRLLGDLKRALPASARCLGATVTALNVLDHAWLSLPLHLEEAAATSVFPLRLLASAARRVAGGLIKFDLFSFPQIITPPTTSAVLRGLSAFPSNLGESFGLPSEPRGARRGMENGGVPLAPEMWGRRASQVPATLLWPLIYP